MQMSDINRKIIELALEKRQVVAIIYLKKPEELPIKRRIKVIKTFDEYFLCYDLDRRQNRTYKWDKLLAARTSTLEEDE
jgi:hypothetical protein